MPTSPLTYGCLSAERPSCRIVRKVALSFGYPHTLQMTAQRSQSTTFAVPLAETLLRDAGSIARHWLDRTTAALPRAQRSADAPDASDSNRRELAARVVHTVVESLTSGAVGERVPAGGGTAHIPGGVDALTLAGWEYGVESYRAGVASVELGQDFDLLEAILLHECEKVAASLPRLADAATFAPEDAFLVARRLHEAVALASTAAAAGHAQEAESTIRTRLRTLRHDLRNPIATIQNVASLMQDEAMPIEMRHDPRYAGMLHRNSTTLGEMVTRDLADAAISPATRSQGQVRVHAVALAVRRSLRSELNARGMSLEIAPELPEVEGEATTLALALRAALSAAIRSSPVGTVLRLGGETTPADGSRPPVLRLTVGGLQPADVQEGAGEGAANIFADAEVVASRMGASLSRAGDGVILLLP